MTREETNVVEQQEVFEAIKAHLIERGIVSEKITPEANLLRDLDLDSLDTMELTLRMEEQFGVEIPDADLEGLETVKDAVELIQQKSVVPA